MQNPHMLADVLEKSIIDYKREYYKSLNNFNASHNDNLVILLYHGVSDVSDKGICNMNKKHIDVKVFYSQMKYLRSNCNLISMDEVIYYKNLNQKFPSNSVVITFDDGFKNNHNIAAPILDKFNIPATFYVCSGMIDSNKLFWTDIHRMGAQSQ